MTDDKSLNIIHLESVGSMFDIKEQTVYPVLDNTEYLQYDENMGVHISEVDSDWFNSLSAKDEFVVSLLTESDVIGGVDFSDSIDMLDDLTI